MYRFDYELVHTTAVILSNGSGDKYEECAADISEDDANEIGLNLADHRSTGDYLRNDEEVYVYTGWLIVDRNNEGDCFSLTDETGRCVIDATPERAHELYLAYIRESIENNVDVSDANRALVAAA